MEVDVVPKNLKDMVFDEPSDHYGYLGKSLST